MEWANKLIFVQQYELAKRLFEDLMKEEGFKCEGLLHLRYIELCNKLDQLDQIKDTYLQKLNDNSSTLEEKYTYEISLIAIDQQKDDANHDEALLRIQEVIKDSDSAYAYYVLGFSHEANADLSRAIYAYEKSISLDPNWYPSHFGLSQCFYQQGEDKKGDQFFFAFEKDAPYNVYGNFETHRRLSKDFLNEGEYRYAETAISTLSDWWYENKSYCPLELQVYEALMCAHILDTEGDFAQCKAKNTQARLLANQILNDENSEEGVIYFVARALEEFSQLELALEFYKLALKKSGADPQTVQRIGSQFLALGEVELAYQLFLEAYNSFPNSNEIKFCLLVSRLKKAGVNVEEYLLGKERLRQLVANQSDKVETLALLHSLLGKFKGDPEVHYHIGDVYLTLNNINKARTHFEQMYELDPKGRTTILRHATFLMEHFDSNEAMEILSQLDIEQLTKDQKIEVNWLKANHLAQSQDFSQSQELIKSILQVDPWNVSYLVHQINNFYELLPLEEDMKQNDSAVKKLITHDEADLNWSEYDKITRKIEDEHHYEMAFARWKLRYLYSDASMNVLLKLVASACQHDPEKATYDFLKLINTNFDLPEIYWALGTLYKELWQLETSGVWFKQLLLHPDSSQEDKARAYLELADCYVWRDQNLNKAIQYAKLAIDLGESRDSRVNNILAHAHMKIGQVVEARNLLEATQIESDIETIYLNGLLHYRNGAKNKANEIWKPLLTKQAECIRDHNIKQQLLGYYFDKKPYLNVQ